MTEFIGKLTSALTKPIDSGNFMSIAASKADVGQLNLKILIDDLNSNQNIA